MVRQRVYGKKQQAQEAELLRRIYRDSDLRVELKTLLASTQNPDEVERIRRQVMPGISVAEEELGSFLGTVTDVRVLQKVWDKLGKDREAYEKESAAGKLSVPHRTDYSEFYQERVEDRLEELKGNK